MGWSVRHCSWVLDRVQIKSDGRTTYRNMLDKDYDKELVYFGGICLFRNHDADPTNLELRWNNGVFDG